MPTPRADTRVGVAGRFAAVASLLADGGHLICPTVVLMDYDRARVVAAIRSWYARKPAFRSWSAGEAHDEGRFELEEALCAGLTGQNA